MDIAERTFRKLDFLGVFQSTTLVVTLAIVKFILFVLMYNAVFAWLGVDKSIATVCNLVSLSIAAYHFGIFVLFVLGTLIEAFIEVFGKKKE